VALQRDDVERSSRLSTLFEHDLAGKPIRTFPDHALFFLSIFSEKPVPALADHALILGLNMIFRKTGIRIMP
jgi:hypothetical protein